MTVMIVTATAASKPSIGNPTPFAALALNPQENNMTSNPVVRRIMASTQSVIVATMDMTIDDIDTYFVVLSVVKKEIMQRTSSNQLNITTVPTSQATAFPPLNLRKMEWQWPMAAARPAPQ